MHNYIHNNKIDFSEQKKHVLLSGGVYYTNSGYKNDGTQYFIVYSSSGCCVQFLIAEKIDSWLPCWRVVLSHDGKIPADFWEWIYSDFIPTHSTEGEMILIQRTPYGIA